MHTLHVIAYNAEQPLLCVRGIRSARRVLGDTEGGTLRASKDALDAMKATGEPALVGTSEDAEAIANAAVTLETESRGALRAAVDATEDELSGPLDDGDEDDDEADAISAQAYRTAMALIHFAGGAPGTAIAMALCLRNTADDDMYEQVVVAILTVFPPADQEFQVSTA